MDISLPASAKPQLLRAAHEWCTENGFAPYLLVMVDGTVAVPKEFVKDGQIVLNTSYEATGDLTMTNDWVRFKARFGGKPRDIQVPMNRVAALFARETGQGIVFDVDLTTAPEPPAIAAGETGASGAASAPGEPPVNPTPKPFLTRVK